MDASLKMSMQLFAAIQVLIYSFLYFSEVTVKGLTLDVRWLKKNEDHAEAEHLVKAIDDELKEIFPEYRP